MRRITISLPDALFAELQSAANATEVRGYGPAHWAGDLVASELASRRLPSVSMGSHGPRIMATETEPDGHRVVCPEMESV
jgi:hypothetical protein